MTTTLPDFSAADRRHFIEASCSASSVDTVEIILIAMIVEGMPDAVRITREINVLVAALKAKRWADVAVARASLEQPSFPRDLRDGITLLCAVGEAPHSAAPLAQAYAAIAVELSRWLRDSARRATSPEHRAVVRRVEQRARMARLLSSGWSALAGGMTSDYVEASATSHAAALGAEVEAATAPRAAIPVPESHEESAVLREGWHTRIYALYAHLGVGYIAAGMGWFGLIEETLEQIDATLLPEDVEAFRITDVKEKYGTLRIYTDNAPDAVEVIIEVAERRSALTCDRCGEYGRVGGRRWLACRCGRHEQN